MPFNADSSLPVTDILDDLKLSLSRHHEAILQAPPGAGKTTLVPLALASEAWLGNKKILMLEPRRIAARTAAHRMADLLQEPVGQTVGYRMRLDTRVSPRTKIEVITEGILTRMLQDDPSLDDVGLVIFDEFHERSLDADLALTLCLKGRALFREDDPLKILVMSATLDSEKLESLTGAEVIRSEGKQYPVEVVHISPKHSKGTPVDDVVTTAMRVLADHPESNVLVFLPGQGEIRRVENALAAAMQDRGVKDVYLRPLYGNLSLEAQQAAIAPVPEKHQRKVVLATNIAETSLTIEGVDVVIDTGLAREPVFDPATGMTRLHTRKISQASSTQRMGRAGRLRPGTCYRLWSKDRQSQMSPHATPEILNADLAPVVLQLLQWGISDPAELAWLDTPAPGPWLQAVDLLKSLGAVTQDGAALMLTHHGRKMTDIAAHPRLAHMLLCGQAAGHLEVASLLASVLSDRDPFGRSSPDMYDRINILLENTRCPAQHRGWLHRTRKLASQFRDPLARQTDAVFEPTLKHDQLLGFLIACAYPDRVARRRHAGGFQLANGRGASLAGSHSLGKSKWLAVAEVSGVARSNGDMIQSAAILDDTLFTSALAEQVAESVIVEWDSKTKRFVAEKRQTIGALILRREKLSAIPSDTKVQALVEFVRNEGLDVLPFNTEIRQWQARVQLARAHDTQEAWPDVSNETLLASLSDWLGPYLEPINILSHFKKLDLKSILSSLLSWEQTQRLNQIAPQRLKVPSGASHLIDYTPSPPVLAVKLQEMFGCLDTPTVIEGKVPLTVHLLSPAGRPLQVTQDLSGFWQSSYQAVRKEMKGRYPKHPWPLDPLTEAPTAKTKPKTKP